MPSASIAELAWALQTAKGSIAASSTRRAYLSGGTMPQPVADPQLETRNSTVRIPSLSFVQTVQGLGAPEMIVRPNMIGALLYAALGTKAVSGASDPWTHTFTIGAALPYLTLWRHFGGILNERIADARIARLTISGASGRPLKVSAELLSGAIAYRTAQETTAAVETGTPFFEMADGRGALKVEGAAVASIASFTLTITTGCTLVETLAGPVPLLSGLGDVTLQAEQTLVDATLWNRMIYGASSPTNLQAPAGVPLELAGSPAGIEFMFTPQTAPERSLKLALPRVALQLDPLAIATSWQPARLSATYRAMTGTAGQSAITATLKNSVSSY